MKLIIGLGNIGKEYQNTRHNIGFKVIDMLAIKLGSNQNAFKKHSKAPAVINALLAEHNVILAKPTTMMNLSGQAIITLMDYYKIEISDIWVVHDDLDLLFGQLRVRRGGGSAGNNGIKSIIQNIGEGFWRIRIGIGNPLLPVTPTDKFVLDSFNSGEMPLVPQIISNTVDYLSAAIKIDNLSDHTQDLLNSKE